MTVATPPVVLQRVVLPVEPTAEIMPLYVDVDDWTILTVGEQQLNARVTARDATADVRGRRGLAVGRSRRASFASYFNAFPASYWRRWTDVREIELVVTTRGRGEVAVIRSNARGVFQTVSTHVVAGETTTRVTLSLDYFLDGGWYWFEVSAHDDEFALDSAEWRSHDREPRTPGSAVIAITTMDREDYLLPMLSRLAEDEVALADIAGIVVIDQGSRRVADAPGFAELETRLAGRLRVIVQDNIGGSGGFSRGMFEALGIEGASHVLLLDDDVRVEPECVVRAVRFAERTTTPTIVGGHMFDLHDPSRLHAYAEGIDAELFDWGPIGESRHDFSTANLRQTEWIHRRADTVFNGWWMCLIPLDTVRELGLSLPVFIKWDDAEYALRAAEAGIPTVTLPGVAVWHVSWVDKDDSHDWQAYYHARNRLLAALLHSPARRGGRLLSRNFALDVRYLLTADYYTVRLRLLAYANVLTGPDGLHDELRTRLPELRALATEHSEARLLGTDALPAARPFRAPLGAVGEPGRLGMLRIAAIGAVRRWLSGPANPDAVAVDHISYADARWWRVLDRDAFLVSNAQGSGVYLHRHDGPVFRRMLRESRRARRRLTRRWDALAALYRAELPGLVSVERWERTFRPDA